MKLLLVALLLLLGVCFANDEVAIENNEKILSERIVALEQELNDFVAEKEQALVDLAKKSDEKLEEAEKKNLDCLKEVEETTAKHNHIHHRYVTDQEAWRKDQDKIVQLEKDVAGVKHDLSACEETKATDSAASKELQNLSEELQNTVIAKDEEIKRLNSKVELLTKTKKDYRERIMGLEREVKTIEIQEKVMQQSFDDLYKLSENRKDRVEILEATVKLYEELNEELKKNQTSIFATFLAPCKEYTLPLWASFLKHTECVREWIATHFILMKNFIVEKFHAFMDVMEPHMGDIRVWYKETALPKMSANWESVKTMSIELFNKTKTVSMMVYDDVLEKSKKYGKMACDYFEAEMKPTLLEYYQVLYKYYLIGDGHYRVYERKAIAFIKARAEPKHAEIIIVGAKICVGIVSALVILLLLKLILLVIYYVCFFPFIWIFKALFGRKPTKQGQKILKMKKGTSKKGGKRH